MVEREQTKDGLTLLTERVPGVRSAAIGVWLRSGSRHEPERLSGICHFIEHLVFKGTASRTAREIALLTDRMGGNLDAFTTKETTCFYARVLDEHIPLAIDLLADIVRHPRFDPEELERERKVILEEIRMVLDTPEDRVYDLFCERFWPDNPLGRPIQGTEATVAAMSRATVARWFRQRYVPGNVVVAAAGRIGARDRRRLQEAFTGLPAGPVSKNGRAPRFVPGIALENRRELEQVHLLLGLPALQTADPRRFVLHVLNTLLGGSLSSRLFHRIREERGLAYSVSSQVHTHVGAGLLTIYAGTSPANAREVVQLALGELRGLASSPPTAEEVALAREQLKGNVLLALESTSSRMSRAAREELSLGKQLGMDEVRAMLDACTPEAVRALAEDLFAGAELALAAVGRTAKLGIRAKDLAV